MRFESAAQHAPHEVPKISAERQRQMLDADEEVSGIHERAKMSPENAAQEYLLNSQTHVNEGLKLANELVYFQQNGIATAEGNAKYRNELTGILHHLTALDSYPSNLPQRLKNQVEYSRQRNAYAIQRIRMALDHTAEATLPRNRSFSPSQAYSPGSPTREVPPNSPWAKRDAPAPQPKKSFWSKLKFWS